MSIELPELPFAMDALEPHMSKRTLEFHYGKHHKAYVNKLNELIAGTPLDKSSLEEIILATHEKKPKIFNNAAQAWNHAFFWNCLTPTSQAPSEDFEQLLTQHFGSVQEFKDQFTTSAKDLFGSGWAWLVKDKSGKLKIRALSNAETPLVLGEIPLLTCDVWEHAYYLDYQNERPKYLEHFWKLVNWQFAAMNAELEMQQLTEQSYSTQEQTIAP